MDNIQDWCISRQLWWGHRIPIWYDESNAPYAGFSEADVRKKHGLKGELRQEEDVLDMMVFIKSVDICHHGLAR